MARMTPEEVLKMKETGRMIPMAIETAADRIMSNYNLRSSASLATELVDRVKLSEWRAGPKMPATSTEVLMLALLLINNEQHGGMSTIQWSIEVLQSQGDAEAELGNMWAPPQHDSVWNAGAPIVRTMREALKSNQDVVAAVIDTVANWAGAGGTDGSLPPSAVKKWIAKCAASELRGPDRGKSQGSPRYVHSTVQVARLLRMNGGELGVKYSAALRAVREAAEAKPEMTKAELAAEIIDLEREHEAELQNLRGTISELDALVAEATRRAATESKKREQAVSRGKEVRKKVNAHWKDNLRGMREAWRQAAVEDVEAAHGSAVVRLKELKSQAHAAKREALQKAERAAKLSEKRLEKMQEAQTLADDLKERIEELERELHDSAADAVEKLAQIRQVKTQGTGHGKARWWPWWVRAMIMEQLVNGTPPTAIPANIASDAAYLVPFLDVQVPSIDLCRRMRGELRIVCETLAAYRIAKAGNWRQLFTDGTSRRQTSLLTTIIGIDGPDGELIPVVLRGAFVATGDTAEQQVEDIMEKAILRGGAKLKKLREVFEELFPGVAHDIPNEEAEMSIAKLGGGGAITSDNCATAMKIKRLLVERVQKAVEEKHGTDAWAAMDDAEKKKAQQVLEVDCWNHLRNVWLGAVTTALSNRLADTLHEELNAIDSRLRVGTKMEALLRAADKEFSLCANYPKGHGDLFKEWIGRTHPKMLLFHVAATEGSRQDLAFEGSGPVYMNRRVWTEFLDERLRIPGADNILQECLFIILTSIEMIATTRIHAIIHLCLVTPLRFLAGRSHTLKQYNWSERSMGRTVDLLEAAMEKTKDDGRLMLDQTFILRIFDELANELPPLKEYLSYVYDTKSMRLAGSSITVHQFAQLRDELFNPTDADNVDSTDAAIDLAQIAAEEILKELRDPHKASSRHLTSADGVFSWGNTSMEDHEASLGKFAVNDPAESIYGAVTREISVFGRIGFGNASGVAMARRNKDFVRGSLPTEKRKTNAVGSKAKLEHAATGIFHSLSVQMREALIVMAGRNFHSEATVDREDLLLQRQVRRRKEELAASIGREKASEQYIDALYYHEMWNSDACWKTEAKAKLELGKLQSENQKLQHLKEQIRIRVLGLGWKDLSTAWSKDGKAFSSADLMSHLLTVIREQGKRAIPTKPPVPGLARKELQPLGKRTSQVAELDEKEAADGANLEAVARATKAQREAKGVGDSYQQRQGSRPDLDDKIIGKRIEVVFHYTLPEGVFGQALMWCSGVIVDLDPRPYSTYPKGKSATVRWDANHRVEPPEPVSTSGCKLLPSLWNKDGVGAWRFDLDPHPEE